jgi:hypothetical protein
LEISTFLLFRVHVRMPTIYLKLLCAECSYLPIIAVYIPTFVLKKASNTDMSHIQKNDWCLKVDIIVVFVFLSSILKHLISIFNEFLLYETSLHFIILLVL